MDDRVTKLNRARELLMEAADLMDEALRMSGMEGRSGSDSDTVRRIASDSGYGGSLLNLALDMGYASVEQPCWTMPLVSPKKQFE
ncbi:MAG: hypothetical protein IJ026_02605 [Candidatus Methanomethylophilaceae archaeon]|nr:hypothetical protein [Candidatus Methanomethylophilaceae archaeon]